MRLALTATLSVALSACTVHDPPPALPVIDVCSHIQDSLDKATCESKVRASQSTNTSPSGTSGVPVRQSLPLSGILSWWAIYYAFGLVIARAVYVDARRREWTVLKIRPVFWAAMCVVDAAFGVLVYWTVHYSRLAPRFPGSNTTLERTREP